jgi:tetratricopeptide (TPR) repeat protein
MRFALVLTVFVMALELVAAPAAFSQESGKISGVVRDSAGAPIAGAHIVLKGSQSVSNPRDATTRSAGDFEFTGLTVGDYLLSVEMAGFESLSRPATITADNSSVHLDISLAGTVGTSENKPGDSGKPPAPQFQAAGVRGLIDAGGYSAAANGAAASGLIKGMADIERGDNDSALQAATELPCDAEPELRASVDVNPKSPDANRKLGEFYLAHGQPARGVLYLQQALSTNEKDINAVRDLADAWLKLQQFDEARELLTRSSGRPDSQTEILLARAYEGSGMFKQAAEQYRLAGQQAPSEQSFFGVGYELILAGLPVEAGQAFDAGLREFPSSLRLLIGGGAAKFLHGDTSGGIRYFLRATKLSPTDPRPYAFLATTVGVQTEETDEVRAGFKHFLDLAPNSADANYDYALSLWDARGKDPASTDTHEIEALLNRSIRIRPEFARAHFQLANVYFERQDYARAVDEYEEALRLAPDLNDAQYRLARAYQYTGQTELAAQQMDAFRKTRNQRSAEGGGMGITIDQFISVISSEASQSTKAATCVARTP